LTYSVAQTIFKEWFVHSRIGRLVNLSDLIEFNPVEKIDKSKEYLFFDMKSIPTNSMSMSEGIYKKSNSGTSFREKDTLFAKITPCLENGKTAFVLDLRGETLARGSTEFIVMRAKTSGSPYLNYCICRDHKFREYAIQSMTGTSGRQRVPVDRLKAYHISYSKEKICRFNNFVSPVFEKIKNNTSQIQTLSKTRDALLPKLMSGQVRVQ
jgi:type I restriction enzyme S subunit